MERLFLEVERRIIKEGVFTRQWLNLLLVPISTAVVLPLLSELYPGGVNGIHVVLSNSKPHV